MGCDLSFGGVHLVCLSPFQEEQVPQEPGEPGENMYFNEEDEAGWEDEADRLYEWTKELSMDDMHLSQQAAI